MKRLLKKNQIIVTFLAILIAVAGYLKYSDNVFKQENTKEVNNSYEDVYKNDDINKTTGDIYSLDENVTTTIVTTKKEKETKSEPGSAILTNENTVGSSIIQGRLKREQIRSKNKESLMEVVNNDTLTKKEREKAIESVEKIAENSEIENNIETLLQAKGFSNIMVTVSDKNVEVIVDKNELTDDKRVQIESVVKRKTDVKSKNIIITPAEDK